MENNSKEFEILQNQFDEAGITKDDFVLVGDEKKVKEQKFQTRPTTFFKDSLKRFGKNKSSLVAAVILGVLLLMAAVVPIFDSSDTAHPHEFQRYLEPKLFDAGTGFWDGTKHVNNIPVDISEMPNATTEEEKQANWWPNPERFESRSAISNKVFTDLTYSTTQTASTYGKEGYIQIGFINDAKDDVINFKSTVLTEKFDVNINHYLSVFDTYDLEKIKAYETLTDNVGIPNNYVIGETALFFSYKDGDEIKEVLLVDYAETHNIGSAVGTAQPKLNISSIIKAAVPSKTEFEGAFFSVRMNNEHNGQNVCALIRSLCFETESTNAAFVKQFTDANIVDATTSMLETQKTAESTDNYKYWRTNGIKRMYMSRVVYCSFVYDTYEAAFGTRVFKNFPEITITEEYVGKEGWMTWLVTPHYDEVNGIYDGTFDDFDVEIIDYKHCPITKPLTEADVEVNPYDGTLFINPEISLYKYYGYETMPRFIMGTDKSGRDMFKYVFEGLATSLMLGCLTFVVCFIFGLIWGSICGYFGGTVDLVMERLTDILSGVPWIVVMTLVIIHLGSTFWTFALALCLTGWIGTAATTRTQFYRFRGREYVLASRTLGASHPRLIFKHILPNAMGTIITGAVLMIPSVIFSEASISYLGLGLKNLSSLGVILSDNQSELTSNPYLLIFPSVVIALLMISFNLFGNGLRDAVNPSLKGEGE